MVVLQMLLCLVRVNVGEGPMGMTEISSHSYVENRVSRRELYYASDSSDSPEIVLGVYSHATSHCSTKSLRVRTSGARWEADVGNRDQTGRPIPLPAGKRAPNI